MTFAGEERGLLVELGGEDTATKLARALEADASIVLVAGGRQWACGEAASLLKKLIRHSHPVTGLVAGRAEGEAAALLLACDGLYWCRGGSVRFGASGRGEISLLKMKLGAARAGRVWFGGAGRLTKRDAVASGWARSFNGSVDEAVEKALADWTGLSAKALSILRELLYHESGLTLGQGEALERTAFALAFAGGDPEKGIRAFLKSRKTSS